MKIPAKKIDRSPADNPQVLKYNISALIQENQSLKKALNEKQKELEAIQNQLFHLQNLTELSVNGATIAHELNNPLTIISAETDEILDILGRKNTEKKYLKACTTNIKNYAHRMRVIIDSFQENLAKDKNPWSKQDIGEIIRKSVALLRPQFERKNVELFVELSQEIPKIWGNASKLESVIQNLMVNAIDAFETSKPGKEKQIFISVKNTGQAITVKVKDTGQGISHELKKNIFTPFFTTKNDKGSGLGLAIVAGFIREHNARIHVVSEVGKGAEFIMKFPIERRNECS